MKFRRLAALENLLRSAADSECAPTPSCTFQVSLKSSIIRIKANIHTQHCNAKIVSILYAEAEKYINT
jgi:hypothetical protein